MLIATGPSVKHIPDSVLSRQDLDYIGVNGAISLTQINFKYYIIVDHNFTNNRFDLVFKVLSNKSCTLFTTPRCLDLILRKVHTDQILCNIRVIEPITEGEVERFLGPRYHIDSEQDHFFQHNNKGFSKHIDNAVFDYFTVAYIALQITYALAYIDIYIAGVDMNNFNQPRFYENSDNKQPTMLDYYLKDTLQAFDTAALFLKQEGINVYNLSLESAIQSFEKLDPNKF